MNFLQQHANRIFFKWALNKTWPLCLPPGGAAPPERCWTHCWSSSSGCPPDTLSADCWGGWSGSHWRIASAHLQAPQGLGGNEEGPWGTVWKAETLLCCCNAQTLVRFLSGMGSHTCKGILEDKVKMFRYQKVAWESCAASASNTDWHLTTHPLANVTGQNKSHQ